MAFQGSLKEFSASDIIQLLATQKKTGCLVLEQDRRRVRVYVQDGRIVSTRGPGAIQDDPLMKFLRRIRRLSDEQLRGITAMQEESKRDLEDLLVNGRYLDAEALASVVERQILDDLTELVEWKDGTYVFEVDSKYTPAILLRLNVEAVLIEAARRADERSRYRELFKDPRQVPAVCELPDPDEELGEEESELFAIIDGQRTTAEIVAAAPLSDHEAYEALQRMVEAGWLQMGAARQGPVPPDPAPGSIVAAAMATATVQPSKPAATRPKPSLPREVVVTAAVMASLAGLWFAAQAVQRPTTNRGEDTAFAAAQVRDVRYVLELYRREHGDYPRQLNELVEGQWLESRQLVINGKRLQYRLNPGRGDYDLILP